MSETKLKSCPFCGGRNVIKTYNNFVPALLCGDCGTIMSIPMASFSASYEKILAEKWNTRKPFDDVMERLEKELRLSEENKEYARSNNPLQYERCDSYSSAIDNAIGFVKEVMGYD